MKELFGYLFIVVLYSKTGLLVIDKPPYHYLGTSINAFKKLKVPFKEYGSEDLKKEFPMLKVPSEYKGCMDMEGGTLKADKALQCYQVFNM